MKQQFPDYNNCIANLANSILKKFGIDEGRKTLQDFAFIGSVFREEAERLTGVYAGMTEDEMTIPLIVIEK